MSLGPCDRGGLSGHDCHSRANGSAGFWISASELPATIPLTGTAAQRTIVFDDTGS